METIKISQLKKIIKEEFDKIIKEDISDFVTVDDFKDYLKKLGYEISAGRIKKTENGFEANIKQLPDKKYFTQIGKNNWVRLSFKDITNPKITSGKFIYNKIRRK